MSNIDSIKDKMINILRNEISKDSVFAGQMTNVELCDKVYSKIKNITIDKDFRNIYGSWNSKSGTLSLKPEVINNISSTISTSKEIKVILLQQLMTVAGDRNGEYGLNKYHFFDDKNRVNGKALNDGITMSLAEDIMDVKTNGFKNEKGIYKILESMYGKERYFKDFLTGSSEVENYIKEQRGDNYLKLYKTVVYTLDMLKDTNDKILLLSKLEDRKQEFKNTVSTRDKYQNYIDAALKKLIGRELRLQTDVNYKYVFLTDIKAAGYKNEIGSKETGYINIQNEINNILENITKVLVNNEEIDSVEGKILTSTNEVSINGIKKQALNIRNGLDKQNKQQMERMQTYNNYKNDTGIDR